MKTIRLILAVGVALGANLASALTPPEALNALHVDGAISFDGGRARARLEMSNVSTEVLIVEHIYAGPLNVMPGGKVTVPAKGSITAELVVGDDGGRFAAAGTTSLPVAVEIRGVPAIIPAGSVKLVLPRDFHARTVEFAAEKGVTWNPEPMKAAPVLTSTPATMAAAVAEAARRPGGKGAASSGRQTEWQRELVPGMIGAILGCLLTLFFCDLRNSLRGAKKQQADK